MWPSSTNLDVAMGKCGGWGSCHGARALFSLPNGCIFSTIRLQISPIIHHSQVLRSF